MRYRMIYVWVVCSGHATKVEVGVEVEEVIAIAAIDGGTGMYTNFLGPSMFNMMLTICSTVQIPPIPILLSSFLDALCSCQQ